MLTYKIFFGIVTAAWMLIRKIYSKRYAITHKEVLKNANPVREKQLVQLVRWSITLSSAIWLFTPWLNFAQFNISALLQIAGIHIGAASAILFYYVHEVLSDNWSPILQIRKQHELITDGPYKLLRHPMYTAMLLWVSANFLISSNWMVGAVQILSVIILLVVRLPEEERMMEEAFPRQYKLYKLKTYRLVPYIY